MKRIILLTMLFTACALNNAYSHPPSGILAELEGDGNTLRVVVYHEVPDPVRHYVKDVKVEKGGKVIGERSFESQTTHQLLKSEIPLSVVVKPGDVLYITAECNLFGKKTKKMIIQ